MDQKTVHALSSTGRHQECLQTCQQLLQSEPKNPLPWKYAGKSLLALGQFDKANQYLTKAHQLDNKDPEITKDIGNSFLNLVHIDEAIVWYEKTLKLNNSYAPALNNLANIKRHSGSFQEALDLYKQAVKADPQLVQAYMGAVRCCLNLGEINQAEALAAQSIKINPKAPSVNEIQGMILQNKNNCALAIKSYQKELTINPKANISLLNLALLLLEQGEAAEAIKLLTRAARFNPSEQCSFLLAQAYQSIENVEEAIIEYQKIDLKKNQNKLIPFNLGVCLLKNRRNNDAIEAFKIAIRIDDSFLPAWLNIVSAMNNEGRHLEALPAALKVLALDPNNSTAYMNLGGLYKTIGKHDKALEATLKSLELKPNNPNALVNLGSIYSELGKLEEALAATLKSLELKPDNPDALVNLGSIYKELERIEEAKTAFHKALRATKTDTKRLNTILNFYDKINEEELLRQAIHHLKSTLPSESLRVTMYEARELFRQKKYKDGWEKLPSLESITNQLNDWQSISKYHGFRAQIAEKINRYDDAYYSFAASQTTDQYRFVNRKVTHNRIEEYISLSTNMSQYNSRINPEKHIEDASNPVFLIGFPRSGTTLLDTILRSHPDVEVIEEKDPLALTEEFGIKNLRRQISNFNSLNDDDLSRMREIYMVRLKSYSLGTSTLIIDKLPLNIIPIPLINLLFPNARIIFALRHPCDSILSCFQQIFRPNPSMANFTDLEKSVHFYDKVMSGWVAYTQNLDLAYVTSKYEDIVDNFDGSVLKVLKHLDLPWNDGVRNYRQTAMNRASINTPSSTQVVQPLYKSSIGRWKNYQKYFSRHMEKLSPWINYFGYEIN